AAKVVRRANGARRVAGQARVVAHALAVRRRARAGPTAAGVPARALVGTRADLLVVAPGAVGTEVPIARLGAGRRAVPRAIAGAVNGGVDRGVGPARGAAGSARRIEVARPRVAVTGPIVPATGLALVRAPPAVEYAVAPVVVKTAVVGAAGLRVATG